MEQLRTYSADDIQQKLESLPKWSFADDLIYREYLTDGWATTLMLVNAIGFLCEAADHHPDLMVSWAKVVVSLSTHSAGGVTDLDLEMARKIEATATWRPAEDSGLRGVSRPFVRRD